ncbi:uncharacterized protein LOC125535101 [Triticum urartu]|uniref:uncharacterized protein LOC125535101 n=1 Tax=Triticum urartu TaxID=4572 RepID=UPI002043D4EA|nr:uncharacterized protein LOC125535101 [Triticum urartu]
MIMAYELATKALVVSLVLGAVIAGSITPIKAIVWQVPAVYVFGNSTLDVGNNNYLPGKNVPRANMPYHGIDMPGSGKPTGRFSNGYNTADFVGLLRPARGGAAAAMCRRDDHGAFLERSALVVQGVLDPAALEAIVCREAFSLAEDLNIQRMVNASDSKQADGDTNTGNQGRYGTVIKEIRQRPSHFICSFTYESHESNVEAHSLAKIAHSLAHNAMCG